MSKFCATRIFAKVSLDNTVFISDASRADSFDESKLLCAVSSDDAAVASSADVFPILSAANATFAFKVSMASEREIFPFATSSRPDSIVAIPVLSCVIVVPS